MPVIFHFIGMLTFQAVARHVTQTNHHCFLRRMKDYSQWQRRRLTDLAYAHANHLTQRCVHKHEAASWPNHFLCMTLLSRDRLTCLAPPLFLSCSAILSATGLPLAPLGCNSLNSDRSRKYLEGGPDVCMSMCMCVCT